MRKITVTKPRFMKIFPKRLIISLAIGASLCTAAFFIAQRIYRSYAEEKADRAYEGISNEAQSRYLDYCDNINNDDAYEQLMTSIAYMFSKYTGVQDDPDEPVPACRLLDKNGEVLCSSSATPMLSFCDYSPEQELYSGFKYYFCHPDVEQAVHEKFIEYEHIALNYSENGIESKVTLCTKAYLGKKYFYPRLSLCFLNSETGEVTELEGTDFYPDDTSSLRFVERSEYNNMWYLDDNDSQYKANKESKIEKAVDEYADSVSVSGDSIDCGDAPAGYLSYFNLLSGVQENEKGEEFYLISVYPCSLFDRYSLQVILTGSAILFLAVCIPLFSSLLTYKDKKAQYEIFTARQQTTNAMAHDLKTPLTSISGYAEMLQGDINPEKRAHYLSMITQNAEQMNIIVTDILELAKSESASQPLNIEKISAEQLCREAISKLSGTFETQKLSCELNVRKNATINADKKLFTQALSNLLHNAAVYSKPETSVRVTLTDKSICIVNTPGHTPKLSADELVKPFVKDDTFRGENSGSGVGLAIAKQDLESMGFELKIEINDNEFRAAIKLR